MPFTKQHAHVMEFIEKLGLDSRKVRSVHIDPDNITVTMFKYAGEERVVSNSLDQRLDAVEIPMRYYPALEAEVE